MERRTEQRVKKRAALSSRPTKRIFYNSPLIPIRAIYENKNKDVVKTIKEIAKKEGIKPKSLQTRIKRHNRTNGTAFDYGLNDQISPDLVKLFGLSMNGSQIKEKPLESLKTPQPKSKPRKPAKIKTKPVKIKAPAGNKVLHSLPYLALPMLMLPLAYGVYFFAAQFVPGFVALGEAFALEFTYVGLAALRNLTPNQIHRAKKIAYWAVAVSILYNIIAAALHQNPELFDGLNGSLYYEGDQLKGLGSFFVFWFLAVLHGLPIGIVSFKIAELLLHEQVQKNKS